MIARRHNTVPYHGGNKTNTAYRANSEKFIYRTVPHRTMLTNMPNTVHRHDTWKNSFTVSLIHFGEDPCICFRSIVRCRICYLVSRLTRHRQLVYPSTAHTSGACMSQNVESLKANCHASHYSLVLNSVATFAGVVRI